MASIFTKTDCALRETRKQMALQFTFIKSLNRNFARLKGSFEILGSNLQSGRNFKRHLNMGCPFCDLALEHVPYCTQAHTWDSG